MQQTAALHPLQNRRNPWLVHPLHRKNPMQQIRACCTELGHTAGEAIRSVVRRPPFSAATSGVNRSSIAKEPAATRERPFPVVHKVYELNPNFFREK